MILQSLHADAEAIMGQVYGKNFGLPPAMYSYQPLAYVVEIDPATDRAELVALAQGDRKKGEAPRADILPYLGRTSGVAAIALVDKAAYVFGIEDGKAAAEGKAKPRNEETRLAFRDMVRECQTQTNLASLDPVVRFLDRWNPASPEFPLPVEMKSNDMIGFRLRGQTEIVSDAPEAKEFWAQFTRAKDSRRMVCLVTGQEGEVETKLPVGIKNVPGGQSAGAALSSFNENAFMSYGLREFSAPISRDAGERVGKALNALLQSPRHSRTMGPFDSGVKYAFWSPAGEVQLFFLADPDPAAVRDLLTAPLTGKKAYAYDDSAPFHILGLSSHSGGRVALRSALTLTMEEMFERQRQWFERTRIVAPNGGEGAYLTTWQLVEAGFRVQKDVPNYLYTAMAETALTGAAPPIALLPLAVRRCVIGDDTPAGGGKTRREHVPYRRAALLKLLLSWDSQTTQFDQEKVERMSDFDSTNADPAYNCGRLLYQLERIQYLALEREANATVVDRYYGGASTTPRTIFPPLLRMAKQAHLPAVRRGKYSRAYFGLQDRLGEIMTHIGAEFPQTFNMRQQGSFALGYYSERARVRREQEERRKAGEAIVEPEDPDAVMDTPESEDNGNA